MLSQKYQERIIQSAHISDEQREALKLWQTEINKIMNTKKKNRPTERDLHEQFFTDVFVKALGYEKRAAGKSDWTIQSEFITDIDVTRPDGVLGYFSSERSDKNVQVVIELKGPDADLDLRQNRKQDRRTPVDQAFSYAHKFDDVEWVIVSNYSEVRLYNKRSSKYAIHFDLTKITDNEHQLKLFILLLSKGNLIAKNNSSTSSALFSEREEELKIITDNFYDDYKSVRLATAENILKHNTDVSIDMAVTYAQTILDRILFAAFLEDLHLIPAETIAKAYTTINAFNPAPIWENFKGLFNAMDTGNPPLSIPAYNGGLFRANPEINELVLDDSLFAGYKILADYDFLSDLRVNILGHVFEKSITDIDTLKAHLRGEENDDTRRHDEGAFYTPDIVTTYIVEKTIGAYLSEIRIELGFEKLPIINKEEWLTDKKNKTRKKHIAFWEAYTERLQGLKIVDPSCGSGAFLVAAFDYLEEEGSRVNKELDRLHAPRLFSHWDREILKNNLFGVDLSPEAAEITRLSLWLKIAKNKEKLVALDHNIQAGNSVVSDPEYAGDMAFNWQVVFPEVMEQGGFDIVIGNPPYVRQELITEIKPTLEKKFKTYSGGADLFIYFYELGYNLLRDGGYLGYISSNKWMIAQYGKSMRGFIKDNTTITMLIDLGEDDLFEGATTYTNMMTFKKDLPPKKSQFITEEAPFGDETNHIEQERLTEDSFQLDHPLFYTIKNKIDKRGTKLEDWKIEMNRGVTTGFNDAFYISDEIKEQLIKKDAKSINIIKPVLRGRNMHKWHYEWGQEWLIFTRRGIKIDEYPAIKEYLEQFYDHLKPKEKGDKIGRKAGSYEWFEIQDSTAYYKSFDKEKIVWSKTASSSQFSIDNKGYYQNNTSHYIIGQGMYYMVALMNSDLVYWYLSNRGSNLRGGYLEFVDWLVKLMPIPDITEKKQKPFVLLSKELHELSINRLNTSKRFTKLLQVETGLEKVSQKLGIWYSLSFKDFLKELSKKKIKLAGEDKEEWHERFNRLQAEIKVFGETIDIKEQQLNTLVHELYGLTEEEIIFYQSGLK